MLYLSGIHALNVPCSLNTCGDWHASALQWANLRLKQSSGSFFGDYGIEKNKTIPEHKEKYNVANHIRAILDLLQDSLFSVAQGMKNDFICTSEYDSEVFDKIYSMHNLKNWSEIDEFMKKEYLMKWVNYRNSIAPIINFLKGADAWTN